MSFDPITGEYRSPFDPGVLPRFEGRRVIENPEGTMLGRAIGRGFSILGQNLGSAAEGIGNVTGLEGLARFGRGVVERRQEAIDRSRALENDTALNFVVGVLGENIPQFALTLAAPLVGGAARGVQGARVGLAASGGLNYALLAGEARETQRAELERQGSDAPIDEAAAFGAAIPAAALETLGGALQARMFSRAAQAAVQGQPFFSRATARSVAGAAARGAAVEGATEAGQQAIMRAQAGMSLTDMDALQDLGISALAGAILGGTIQGGARTLGALRRSSAPPTDEQIAQTVDQALALPPPPQALALPSPPPSQALALPPPPQVLALAPEPVGPAPLPASNALVPFQAAQTAIVLTQEAPGRSRSFSDFTPQALLAQLEQYQRAEAAGQATRDDVRNRQLLQLELRRREAQATTDQVGQARMLADQPDQALQLGLSRLQQLQEQRPLTPAERRIQTMIEVEIAQRNPRRTPEVNPALQLPNPQGSFQFDPPAPAQETAPPVEDLVRVGIENARQRDLQAQEDMRRLAGSMGLKNSRFRRELNARTPDELLDRVLDAVERTNAPDYNPRTERLPRSFNDLAFELGVDRDLRGEISALEARRDQIRQQTGLRTQRDVAQFQEITRLINDLEARRVLYERVTARRAEQAQQAQQAREAQETARQQRAQAQAEARAREAARQAQEAAAVRARWEGPSRSNPVLGALLRETYERAPATAPLSPDSRQQISQARQQEFDAAEAQRRDVQMAGALWQAREQAAQAPEGSWIEARSPEAIARLQEGAAARRQERLASAPAAITAERRQGNTTELTMQDGAVLRLDKRRDGFYLNGAWMGRTIETARGRVLDVENERKGLRKTAVDRVLPTLTDREGEAFESPGGPASPSRGQRVREAIAAATRDWPGSPDDVVVVEDTAELSDVLGSEQSFDTLGIIRPDGKVYIVAGNHRHPTLAVATFFHEVLGHRGLKLAYGQTRRDLFNEIHRTNATVRRLVDDWEASYTPEAFAESYGDLPLHLRVEEALAVMSEGGPIQASLMDRFRKLVADFARLIGIRAGFSDAQVRVIMADAHDRAMRAGSMERTGQISERPAQLRMTSEQPPAAPEVIARAAEGYDDIPLARSMLRVASTAAGRVPDSPEGDATIVQRVVRIARQGMDRFNERRRTDGAETLRGAALYFQSLGHIVTQYGRMFPEVTRDGFRGDLLKLYQRGLDLRVSTREIISRMAQTPIDNITAAPENVREDVLTLMSATALQLDPMRPLADHEHLSPAEKLRRAGDHQRMREAVDRLRRSGNLKAYTDAKATMRAIYMQQHTMDLHAVISENPEVRVAIPEARRHPVMKFLEARATHIDPTKLEEFWRKEYDTLSAAADKFVAAQNRPVQGVEEIVRIQTLVSGIQEQLKKSRREIKEMERYPYFHMGRAGKYFVSFRLPTITESGVKRPDPRAVEAVASALHELGLSNIAMNETAEGPIVFIRNDSLAVVQRIREMAVQLAARGAVDPRRPIVADEVAPLQELPESARETVRVLTQELESMYAPSAQDPPDVIAQKRAYIDRARQDLQTALLARLPDQSTAKVMAHRKFRMGYDKDFLQAFAQRMQIAANASAERLSGSITNDALAGMMAAAREAREGGANKFAMNAVIREIMAREVRAPDTMATNFVDQMRALNHNYFLAFSPGYTVTQVVQMATNVWPELVKQGASWRDAMLDIQRTSPRALEIVRATLADAADKGFGRHGADSTVTADVLQRVALDPNPAVDAEMKSFILKMYDLGAIDMGSASRTLGREAETARSTRFDTTMKWASSYNYYFEVLFRLNTALAARELALRQGKRGDDMVDFARKVVHEAMLNYREDNRGRAFGRQGMLAQFTPLATSFLTYQFHMLEKYSREFAGAVGRGKSPEEQAAARRWLGAHMSAMTVFAGTLGLPFVTVVARVLSAGAEWLSGSEEPIDVRLGWRNFLSDVFGQDVAEVISRGLPRAVGFDISGRVGAQDFFPFSRLIDDRRTWEEALTDMTFRMAGAPTSMVTGILQGGDQLMDGRIMEAMRSAFPVALRNPLEAVRMTKEGIVDQRGNLLPLDPGARDVIWQALGLTPAMRAEYSEANFAQAVRRTVTGTAGTRLRARVVRALQSGDQQALQDALQDVREFDKAVSPMFRVGPTLGRAMMQGMARLETARQLDAPLGLALRDIEGQNRLRFANFEAGGSP